MTPLSAYSRHLLLTLMLARASRNAQFDAAARALSAGALGIVAGLLIPRDAL